MFKDFIEFNRHCPMCGNELSLFMKTKTILWKASVNLDNDYFLSQEYCKNNEISEGKIIKISLKREDPTLYVTGVNGLVEQELMSDSVFFFYICKQSAIIERFQEIEVNAYKACYYRNSHFYDITKNKNSGYHSITPVDKDAVGSRLESFKIHQDLNIDNNPIRKVYIVSFNQAKNNTMLWHYMVNPQDENPFKNNQIFEKEITGTSKRFDFSDKEKILDRLNSWITLS